jgi:hypothetical protein
MRCYDREEGQVAVDNGRQDSETGHSHRTGGMAGNGQQIKKDCRGDSRELSMHKAENPR